MRKMQPANSTKRQKLLSEGLPHAIVGQEACSRRGDSTDKDLEYKGQAERGSVGVDHWRLAELPLEPSCSLTSAENEFLETSDIRPSTTMPSRRFFFGDISTPSISKAGGQSGLGIQFI